MTPLTDSEREACPTCESAREMNVTHARTRVVRVEDGKDTAEVFEMTNSFSCYLHPAPGTTSALRRALEGGFYDPIP